MINYSHVHVAAQVPPQAVMHISCLPVFCLKTNNISSQITRLLIRMNYFLEG